MWMTFFDFLRDFKEFNFKNYAENSDLQFEKELIVFVGQSKYPTRKKGKSPINVKPFGIYNKYSFGEVAFLCDIRTIELFSIMGILCGSIDLAVIIINYLLNNSLMPKFAQYLYCRKGVVLVNANGQISKIDRLLNDFKNHKVCFCCGKSTFKSSSFTALNTTKTKGKYDKILQLLHPSSNSYRTGFDNACRCFWDHTYVDRNSNLTIQDFRVF